MTEGIRIGHGVSNLVVHSSLLQIFEISVKQAES